MPADPKPRRQVRERVQMRRRGRWVAKLDAKRQERRERRADWALQVKARDRRCQHVEGFPKLGLWFKCLRPTTDAHHVLARSQGGPDEMWNGLGMCRRHHDWTHDHRIEAQALGLLAHEGDSSPWPREGAR